MQVLHNNSKSSPTIAVQVLLTSCLGNDSHWPNILLVFVKLHMAFLWLRCTTRSVCHYSWQNFVKIDTQCDLCAASSSVYPSITSSLKAGTKVMTGDIPSPAHWGTSLTSGCLMQRRDSWSFCENKKDICEFITCSQRFLKDSLVRKLQRSRWRCCHEQDGLLNLYFQKQKHVLVFESKKQIQGWG